ncbi:MAG: hypothetical protein ACTSRL_19855 [Candidatus Helarchaeota archaeon]
MNYIFRENNGRGVDTSRGVNAATGSHIITAKEVRKWVRKGR